ncbi:hypothetical protein MKZ38_004845 [Zalerion maritima]|uniref:Cytochrome P450 n=1 Tax=Zalerion maritima TaxID=339359 RepID=A0AAD5RL55_9PEZI|nr:hypothetical protein MKZ38_004845 [Zalerion maritima]
MMVSRLMHPQQPPKTMFSLEMIDPGLAALVLCAFSLLALGKCLYNVSLHPLRAVPGPFWAKVSHWWLFVLEMGRSPHEVILQLHGVYGPVVRISPDEVSINDADAFATMFSTTSSFEKAKYFYRPFEDQAHNLFSLVHREEHAQDKRLMSHAFSRANVIRHQDGIYAKTKRLMDRLAQRARDGEVIPLFLAFRCLTLDAICDFAFGKPLGALDLADFHTPIMDAVDQSNLSIPFFQHFPFFRALLRLMSYYNIQLVPNGFLQMGTAARTALKEMRTSPPQDVATMFETMISSASKKGIELSEEHLVSEGILMIVAGTDTTAASLAVNLHNLLQRPDTYRDLRDEVKTVLPTPDSRPNMADLDALPLLDACIKEAMRICSPVRGRLPRIVPPTGWDFGGHHFKPGTIVSTSPLFYLHDPAAFPSPETYNPARWLVAEDRKIMMNHFWPFSRGTRQCIGQNLSLVEQKIVLAMFVRRFKPLDVLKKNVELKESVVVQIEDPMEVRVDIATE